jgi:hypothetical protein
LNKEYRTVYPLGTGPKGDNPKNIEKEVSYSPLAIARCADLPLR